MTNLIPQDQIDYCKKLITFTGKADCLLNRLKEIKIEKAKREEDERQAAVRQNEAVFRTGILCELPTVQDRLLDNIAKGQYEVAIFESKLDCQYFPQSFSEKIKEEQNIRLVCRQNRIMNGSTVFAKYP